LDICATPLPLQPLKNKIIMKQKFKIKKLYPIKLFCSFSKEKKKNDCGPFEHL
jgi:hypothetical protein